MRPDELDIFKQYLKHHDIIHRYNNISSIFSRIKTKRETVVFWYDGWCLHYFSVASVHTRDLIRVRFDTLYEECIDCTDIMAFL